MKLDFDDVLIQQEFSFINSRKDIKLDQLPVMNANMRNIATPDFIKQFVKSGGIACSHRFQDPKHQLEQYITSKEYDGDHWCSVGVGKQELENAKWLIHNGCNHICVDVAHGAQQQVINFIKSLGGDKKLQLMVGNFGSPSAVVYFLHNTQKVDFVLKLRGCLV
jgi:hypothetical protein